MYKTISNHLTIISGMHRSENFVISGYTLQHIFHFFLYIRNMHIQVKFSSMVINEKYWVLNIFETVEKTMVLKTRLDQSVRPSTGHDSSPVWWIGQKNSQTRIGLLEPVNQTVPFEPSDSTIFFFPSNPSHTTVLTTTSHCRQLLVDQMSLPC